MKKIPTTLSSSDHVHHDHHDHHHDHHDHRDYGEHESEVHEHGSLVVEDDAGNVLAQQMVSALQRILIRKGLLSAGEVPSQIQALEAPGTHLGAKLVARAWVDVEYKKRLLNNGKDAAAELNIKVGEAQLVVVENTPGLHNVVVCTLCSCYPRSILGQPPAWYISAAYRARTVREPGRVLEEFGLILPGETSICVHDSNADMRFLVLPQRPIGTEEMTEDQLAQLVTRDSMIGVAQVVPLQVNL
ncbi:MAG: nitrile hydratase subunit alpha [Hydrogenophaga sp.]